MNNHSNGMSAGKSCGCATDNTREIRVFMIHPVHLMGHIMAVVLNDAPDMEVVGFSTTVDDALVQIEQCHMVLISTNLPDDSALSLSRAVVAAHPSVKVVIVGLVESPAVILPYLDAGVAGYVLQDESVDDLLEKIRAIHRGEARVSPHIAAALIARVAQLAEICNGVGIVTNTCSELTQREREVLTLMGRGLSNLEIAEALTIEVGTVKNHVHNILRKLNISSRKEAALYLALSEHGEEGDESLLPKHWERFEQPQAVTMHGNGIDHY